MKTTGGAWLWALATALAGCGGGGASQEPAAAAEVNSVNVSLAPRTQAYRDGEMLYLEREGGAERSRLGLDLQRGAIVTEASLNGTNFVNAHDTGRGVQIALYDGAYTYDACAGCTGSWGWNPVQGGDRRNRGSAVLSTRIEADAITVRTRALEWLPPDAATDAPVPSDVVIEQRVTAVDGELGAFRVDFRVEYEGNSSRQVAWQEFPSVYAAAQYRRLITYDGRSPWTGGAASAVVPLPLGQTPVRRYSPEQWFALVDDSDVGLSVFTPGSSPYVRGFLVPGDGGPTGAGASFARLDAPLAVQPGRTIAGRYYLLLGDYKRSRETIYRMHAQGDAADLAAPRLALDTPAAGAAIAGVGVVAGWAYDNGQLSSVIVYVDGSPVGQVQYGVSRPDVAGAYPDAPPASGFGFALDTRALTNGRHAVSVAATDAAGNEATAVAEVTIAN